MSGKNCLNSVYTHHSKSGSLCRGRYTREQGSLRDKQNYPRTVLLSSCCSCPPAFLFTPEGDIHVKSHDRTQVHACTNPQIHFPHITITDSPALQSLSEISRHNCRKTIEKQDRQVLGSFSMEMVSNNYKGGQASLITGVSQNQKFDFQSFSGLKNHSAQNKRYLAIYFTEVNRSLEDISCRHYFYFFADHCKRALEDLQHSRQNLGSKYHCFLTGPDSLPWFKPSL